MRGIIIFITAVFSIPTAFADVIYDEQTLDWGNTWNGFTINGEYGFETADDFETTDDWTLEMVRFWVFTYNPPNNDIRVDIFEDTGYRPGTPVFREEVPSGDITWVRLELGMLEPLKYRADIPISGFDIVAATRYWLGLQTTSGDSCYWFVMPNQPEWWSNCYFYDGSTWYDSEDYYGQNSACEFELHGTPDDSGVNARSLGGIKALYR
jgi:hypothetical protein